MSVLVEQGSEKRIVIFTFTGHVDRETIQTAHERAISLLQHIKAYYAVIDIRQAEISLSKIVEMLRNCGSPTALLDYHISPVFVVKTMPPNRTYLPSFRSLTEAEKYVFRSIIRRASVDAL